MIFVDENLYFENIHKLDNAVMIDQSVDCVGFSQKSSWSFET